MATFPLRIGTPDGLLFEGEAERIVCRSITGDLAILAGHCNFCTALGMGEAHVVLADGSRRDAACIGGTLSMINMNAACLRPPGSGRRTLILRGQTPQRSEQKNSLQKPVSQIRNIK